MPVFMVDRSLPGITNDQLAAAQKAAIDTCKTFTSQGKPVRYIRTTFVPGEAHCMCLFEASNADLSSWAAEFSAHAPAAHNFRSSMSMKFAAGKTRQKN